MALTKSEILECILRQFGAEKFNGLVCEAEKTRQHGRLRYWQEQVFRQCAFLSAMPTLEEYLEWFTGAALAPLPALPALTREVFLAKPSEYWNSEQRSEIRVEWFQEAWRTLPAFRDNLTHELVRYVSKIGSLSSNEDLLSYLPGVLNKDEIVTIFKTICDQSGRCEEEWRQEFEAAFPDCAVCLPPREDDVPTDWRSEDTRFDPAQYRVTGLNDDIPTLQAALDKVLRGKIPSTVFMELAELLLWNNPASEVFVEGRGVNPGKLTSEQRALATLYVLDLEVQNGGLSQFFWNRPIWGEHAESSLRRLGLEDLAARFAIDKARVITAYGSLAKYSEGNSLEAYSERAQELDFDAFENAYYDSDRELYTKAIEFVRAHLDGFIRAAT